MESGGIRWTEISVAWATIAQATVILIGIVAAVRELAIHRRAAMAHETDAVFEQLSSGQVYETISRLATSDNPRDEWHVIYEKLTAPEKEPRRVRCEADITFVTNFFEGVYDKYKRGLIQRERYLDTADERTLLIAFTLAKAHENFTRANYTGLFSLAVRCHQNYMLGGGRNIYLFDPKPLYLTLGAVRRLPPPSQRL